MTDVRYGYFRVSGGDVGRIAAYQRTELLGMQQFADLAETVGADDFEVDEVGNATFQFAQHPGEPWRRVASCPSGEGDYYAPNTRTPGGRALAEEIAAVPCMSAVGLESVMGIQDFAVESSDGDWMAPEVVTLDDTTFVALPLAGTLPQPPGSFIEIDACLYFAARERCLQGGADQGLH